MTEEEKTPKNKRMVERSIAYPSINLEEAVNIANDLRDKVSNSPFDRNTFLEVLKISDHRKLAALVHFGLVLRSGNVYSLTDLSKNISFTSDEDSLLDYLQQAVLTPKLYKLLVDKFTGQAIPSALPNILILQTKINSKVAKNVASNFKKSLEYAGLLKNNIINQTDPELTNEEEEDINTVPQEISKRNDVSSINKTTNYLQIPLKSGVIVSFPKNFAYDVATGKYSEPLEILESLSNSSIPANDVPIDSSSK